MRRETRLVSLSSHLKCRPNYTQLAALFQGMLHASRPGADMSMVSGLRLDMSVL